MGESTSGMPLNTMVQYAALKILDFENIEGIENIDSSKFIFKESIISPLALLYSLKAEALWNVLNLPFPLMRASTLVAAATYAVMIFICDRASSNKRVLKFVITFKYFKIKVIILFCLAHITHSCSNAQACILDDDVKSHMGRPPAGAPLPPLPLPPAPLPPAGAPLPVADLAVPGGAPLPPVPLPPAPLPPAGAAPLPPVPVAKGKGKGKGYAKAKGKAKAAPAVPPNAKAVPAKKPARPTFLSSLVRGCHLFNSATIWKVAVAEFGKFVNNLNITIISEEEVLFAAPDASSSWQRNRRRNTIWFDTFIDAPGAIGRVADRSRQDLKRLIGATDLST